MLYSISAHKLGGTGFYFNGNPDAPDDSINVLDDYARTAVNLSDGWSYSFDAEGVLITTPPTAEQELASVRLSAVKRLTAECGAHIIAGLDIGGFHYPTTRNDQLDISGLYNRAMALGVGGEPYKFICADAQGVWARRDHTEGQIQAVGLSVSQHVIDAKDKLDTLVAAVNAVAKSADPTQADFDAISW